MNHRVIALSLVVGFGTVACGSSDEGVIAHVVTRDSAGITIVENVAQEWTTEDSWILREEPLLEIGVVEGDPAYMFSRAMSPVRLSDGTIVVADIGTAELRFFDSSGNHLHTIGGRGEGPGEFRFPLLSLYGPRADTLLAWDPTLRRVTLVSSDGAIGRTLSFSNVSGFPQPPALVLSFSNGELLLAFSSPVEMEESGSRWAMRTLVRTTPELDSLVGVGEYESQQCSPKFASDCALGPYIAFGGVQTQGELIYTGRPDRNEINVLDENGRVLRKIYGARPIQTITDDVVSGVIEMVLASDRARSDPKVAADIREGLTSESFPESVPAFLGFMIARDGSIWTEEYRLDRVPFVGVALPPRTVPIQWTVFDSMGIQLGSIAIPPDFEVSEIGEDYVLGIHRDSFGIEKVQLRELVKP